MGEYILLGVLAGFVSGLLTMLVLEALKRK